MKKYLVINLHQYYEDSVVTKSIMDMAKTVEGVDTMSIMDTPFDTTEEIKIWRDELVKYDEIILAFPAYWYNFPWMGVKWFEYVFGSGFAYGKDENGNKVETLKNINFRLWTSTGAPIEAYSPEGYQKYNFHELLIAIENSFSKCGIPLTQIATLHGKGKGYISDPLDRDASRGEIVEDGIEAWTERLRKEFK